MLSPSKALPILTVFAVTSLYVTVCSAGHARTSEKPKVYNYVGPGADLAGDSEMKAIFGKKYAIVDLVNKKGYVASKPTTRVSPKPLMENGHALEGSVRVALIVNAQGQVREPVVISSTNRKLNETVLNAIRQWRGTPARLNGVAVPMVYSQDFTFTRRR